ncbi:MAG: hypothetical protein M3Y27_28020 [Acidobacteriota bacterium]|nr:hypothetical protein [Acidobacteriota bacterium]
MRIALVSRSLIALTGAGWKYSHRAQPLESVQVATAVEGNLKSATTATGSLQPRRSVDIKFDGQNFVEHLYVNERPTRTVGKLQKSFSL